jgi:serpin B
VKRIILSTTAVAILALTACGPGPAGTTPGRAPGEAVASDLERVSAPRVSDSDRDALVAGNSAFALDLYQRLAQEQGDENLFYSPYSISLALAMTYAGARGQTEQQMADTLHYTLPQDRLHPAFNALDQALISRGEGAAGQDGEGFRLNIANAIWGQESYTFLEPFLDTLAQNYGAGLRVLDFAGAPEMARVIINDWVSEKTEGRIEELIPQGALSPVTRLVLTNAVYFNAAWARPFEAGLTSDGAFHLLDGGEANVPMMHQTASFGYAAGPGYQAVELPYDGNELSMVVLVPDAGDFRAFEASLDAERLAEIVGALEHHEVALTMPRFGFDASFGLNDALQAMGIEDAFSDAADFSGMTGDTELFISSVIHQAFVSVDEAGTEAAAATAVVMAAKGLPSEPVQLTVDRPFIFAIRDIQTSALLFVGRVLDPS